MVKGSGFMDTNIVNVGDKGVRCDCSPFVNRQKHFVCDHIQFVEKIIGGVRLDAGETVTDMITPKCNHES
jgi:hypothetical protein